MKARVLIGGTVRQKPAILQEFLQAIKELDTSGLHIDYMFIDNNDDETSSQLLKEFLVPGSTTYLVTQKSTVPYHCSEETHHWTEQLIWTIASYKNGILQYAAENNYSHVFMLDSDLVLHPCTLKQLLSTGKDIISEIFWTKWRPEIEELPQVWLSGQYSQTPLFLEQLRVPGVYEVGGLGACTLISRLAITSGVNYQRLRNVDYWGEDRHLCIRAVAHEFNLYVDTHYPAFHIYRESELPKVAEYKQKQVKAQTTPTRKKLTLSMIVRNEENRYLQQVLEHAKRYIDAAVIIDDGSTDNTVQLCRSVLKDLPLHLVEQKESTFANEYKLRQKQWEETIKTNPDWILVLDADEIFENKIVEQIDSILQQNQFDVYSFRLYDFWTATSYREDKYWQAHKYYRPFLVRYLPSFQYEWHPLPQHCGRLPYNITKLKTGISPLRVKHLGWSTPQDRQQKYQRYLKLDPDAKYGIKEQYQSILDPEPRLIMWEE